METALVLTSPFPVRHLLMISVSVVPHFKACPEILIVGDVPSARTQREFSPVSLQIDL